MKKNKGYTLIEMMVVIIVFSVLAIVVSETVISTLKGTSKSAAISSVRQNLDYAIGSMERQIRGAQSITSTCNGAPATQISFIDQNLNPVTFSCNDINSNGQVSNIASSSASLTSGSISISSCSFTCTNGTTNSPPSVLINITASDIKGQNAPITETTQITLRSY
ncbi:MAG TPA: prepilin-type N-terminal cleavage/methylation domain-containing protein [Patescibacteria group bacterium]|nr:prepilin-type N-terminal cleavage/methylation domain-containing protein [Patescibacteria group bacterium]